MDASEHLSFKVARIIESEYTFSMANPKERHLPYFGFQSNDRRIVMYLRPPEFRQTDSLQYQRDYEPQ